MSEDGEASDGGWCHLKLNWRSDNITKFFTPWTVGSIKREKKIQKNKQRTCSGVSSQNAPKNVPTWAIKLTAGREITLSASATEFLAGAFEHVEIEVLKRDLTCEER